MAGVPINFAVPGEGAVASYNWTDIAEGVGYVTFYGYVSRNGLNTLIKRTLTMTTNPNYSSGIKFKTSALNYPKTISGTLVANWTHLSAGSNQKATCQVSYIRNGVETAISSLVETSDTFSSETSVYLSVPLTTTNLKAGDIIQIEIKHTGSNATFRQDTHRPTFDVPFKIDL